MKYKFFIPFLWIGLAFATSGYTKPAHFKHAGVSSKEGKTTSRHIASRTKNSIDKHLFSASNNRKRSKLHTIHSLNHIDRSYPSISTRNIHLAQDGQGNLYLESVKINDHNYTLIPAHTKHEVVVKPINSGNETPGHITSVHGIISSSLNLAGQKAGLSNELILQLTNIFAWDIDFATNLQQGDQFIVVYEEIQNGNNLSDFQIIAAEFVNQGKVFTAIRYKDSGGQVNYFSPEGRPMRKAFLSTPVDFARISSGFDTHRRHPILNRIRAHKGIDYAAQSGTPVKSSGDGEVTFCGNKGGYGQVLMIKHGDHYETLYAHLSEFRKGLEIGALVKQGDVIGYIGQTGLATGPHLHYEFRVDGVHRNPESLNLAQSLPLHAEVLADFKTQTRTTLNQLYKTKAQTLFAENQYKYN